ncbi:hypothetical protein A2U01_0112993, partial [Trifolium medium]|nr:hypothetical protein [Trifolium medium]
WRSEKLTVAAEVRQCAAIGGGRGLVGRDINCYLLC